MGFNDLSNYSGSLNLFSLLMLLTVVIDLPLRGLALWRAAKNCRKVWFVSLFIFNTMGILPLIYLVFFQKSKETTAC